MLQHFLQCLGGAWLKISRLLYRICRWRVRRYGVWGLQNGSMIPRRIGFTAVMKCMGSTLLMNGLRYRLSKKEKLLLHKALTKILGQLLGGGKVTFEVEKKWMKQGWLKSFGVVLILHPWWWLCIWLQTCYCSETSRWKMDIKQKTNQRICSSEDRMVKMKNNVREQYK